MAPPARIYTATVSNIVPPKGVFSIEAAPPDGDAEGALELVGELVGSDIGLDGFCSNGDMTCVVFHEYESITDLY